MRDSPAMEKLPLQDGTLDLEKGFDEDAEAATGCVDEHNNAVIPPWLRPLLGESLLARLDDPATAQRILCTLVGSIVVFLFTQALHRPHKGAFISAGVSSSTIVSGAFNCLVRAELAIFVFQFTIVVAIAGGLRLTEGALLWGFICPYALGAVGSLGGRLVYRDWELTIRWWPIMWAWHWGSWSVWALSDALLRAEQLH
ncbi:hypothetical protein JCM3770_001994 [Rhodotorula araucariae]